MKKALAFLILLPLLFWGCPEIEKVSPVPHIEFQDFTIEPVYDSTIEQIIETGILKFSFVDGDADLGVYSEVDSNTSLPDSVRHGIFINLYEKIGGIYYKRIPTQLVHERIERIGDDGKSYYVDTSYIDTIKFDTYLPYNQKLDRVGENKTVKGYIRTRIPFEVPPPYDSMKFEFYIRDRALHKSNVESTTDFSRADIVQAQGL